MIKNVQAVPLQVRDLDSALEFYTQKVGLEVGTDITNDGYRWLTVKVPGTNSPEIVLMPAEADLDIPTCRGGFVFHSDDCVATHKALAARGVEFAEAPTQHMWGIQALFMDPDGNGHVVLQPASMPQA